MAARAEVSWGHTEHLRGRRIETPVGMKSGSVDRFCHRVSPAECVPHPLRPVRRRIRFRRDAGEGFKDTVEVKTAHAGSCGERREIRYILSGRDQMARLRYCCGVLFGEPRLVRSAPFTGPEACLFGLFAGCIETDMRAACQPCRAGWPAIDAGSPYRIIERAVRGAVAPHHRLPPCLVARERWRGPSGLCPR